MLSKTSSRLFAFVCRWTSLFGGLPFVWDNRRSLVRSSQRAWGKWTFFWAYLMINWAVLGLKVLTLMLTYALDPRKKSGAQFIYSRIRGYEVMILLTLSSVFAINTWVHFEEILCFVNSFIRYCQHFRNANIRRLPRRLFRNGCENQLKLVLAIMIVMPILSQLMYFSNPQDFRFITYFLPKPPITPRFLYYPILFGYGMLQIGWSFSVISTVGFTCTLWFLMSSLLFQMLRELKGGEIHHFSRPSLRKTPRLCSTYRSLQILVRLWNNSHRWVMFPLKWCSQSFAILGNVILIEFSRMETPMSRLILLLGPNLYLGIWLCVLHRFGMIWKKSGTTVKSWQYLRHKVYEDFVVMRKFSRSAEPLKIKIGQYYFVRPVRVLDTLRSVFKQTAKSVIGIGKQLK